MDISQPNNNPNNMIPEAYATTRLIASFKKEILGLLSDAKDEISHLLDDGVTNYLNSQRSKYELTKTFLFGNEPVAFYESYFPVGIKPKEGKASCNTEKDILNIFKDTNYNSIIGVAGSGKTMLMKHVFLQSLYSGFKIPIAIELRDFNNANLGFYDYVKNKIFNNMLSPNEKILERLFQEGAFIFLLDGFDELFSANIDKTVREIDDFIDKFYQNKFLLTSRPGTSAENFQRFRNLYVEPLSEIQIQQFIVKQTSNVLKDDQLGDVILGLIKKPENKNFRAYLNSPLLLSMFIITCRTYPELPKLKSRFYWNVYDTLVTKHDSITKRGAYQHERKSGLNNDEIESIVQCLAYLSLFEGKYIFDKQYFVGKLNQIKEANKLKFENENFIYDLTVSISIIIVEGLDYRFPHKTLQEYFAASFISKQNAPGKEKIYIEKFDNSQRVGRGDSSFFNLCAELDKENFNKLFILRVLKAFIDKLSSGSDLETKAKGIVDIFNFRESYEFNVKTGKLGDRAGTSISSIQVGDVLNYLNYPFHVLSLMSTRGKKEAGFEEFFLNLYKRNILNVETERTKVKDPDSLMLEVNISRLENADFKKYCSLTDLTNRALEIERVIREQINKIEDDLKSDSDSKMALLDLS